MAPAPPRRSTAAMRQPLRLAFVSVLPLCCLAGVVTAQDAATAVDRVPVAVAEAPPWYAHRTAPLAPNELLKLPVGAIAARGWLARQLELQLRGFHGHLGELSRFLQKPGNAWLSPTGDGDHGWEEVPYWLKGFGDCAYLLRDEAAIAEARTWIEAALASQREDGFFGPRGNGAKATVKSTDAEWDLWPNMPMLDALRSWFEFRGDERVPAMMARYFRWQLQLPDPQFVPPYWQHLRAFDNLWSVYWLYERTADADLRRDLLQLGEKIHRCAARWEDGIVDWHNVNVLEGFGGPTFFALQSHDARHRSAAERNFQEFRSKYGQVPGGLFGSDEIARPGCTDPRQAVETCGMVEFLFSCERLLLATGDTVWADRAEDVAFNSLPAAQTADLRALRYLTAPNMATSDRQNHAPGLLNGGAMYSFDPHAHRCCQHNVGHGWPYLAEHLWFATADRGACLMFPLASAATVKVGGAGQPVELECHSDYPFYFGYSVVVRGEVGARFPLYLRVPAWSTGVDLAINDAELAPVAARGGQLVRIERDWQPGDRVRVNLRAERQLQRWPGNRGAVSVVWGPLTYSLDIPTRTVRDGGSDAWPSVAMTPTGPWNYALDLSAGDPVVAVQRRTPQADSLVWTPEQSPIVLTAKARRAPGWGLDRFALVAPLVDSPVRCADEVEQVRLVPMGASRLRISAFPVAAAKGEVANDWPPPPQRPHPDWLVSASHCFSNDTPDALGDGVLPMTSNDHSLPRLTWWPHQGTAEWAMYELPAPLRLVASEVYWFDDTPRGGCAIPARWHLAYLDAAGQWVPVPGAEYDEPARDRWCKATSAAVETKALRLMVELQPGKSGGVLEWRVTTAP